MRSLLSNAGKTNAGVGNKPPSPKKTSEKTTNKSVRFDTTDHLLGKKNIMGKVAKPKFDPRAAATVPVRKKSMTKVTPSKAEKPSKSKEGEMNTSAEVTNQDPSPQKSSDSIPAASTSNKEEGECDSESDQEQEAVQSKNDKSPIKKKRRTWKKTTKEQVAIMKAFAESKGFPKSHDWTTLAKL